LSKNLDLYAKVEPYIGFYEEYDKLHDFYLDRLKEYDIKSVLDVGCGNGNMLLKLQKNGYDAEGIDLSQAMVDIARKKGVNASCKDISQVKTGYDAVIAVADVLNYIPMDSLRDFLTNVARCLKDGGLFLCDINTLYGFSSVAEGALVKDEGDIFFTIDAVFEENILYTDITLFEKEKTLYKKSKAEILQYYHLRDDIKRSTVLDFIKEYDISMFSKKSDKVLLVFMK